MYEIIKITKKRNSNYNLYIKDYRDEKIEIHLDILYSYALYKNYEIDDDTFAQMLIENEKKLAKQRVLKILATANKTKKEMEIFVEKVLDFLKVRRKRPGYYHSFLPDFIYKKTYEKNFNLVEVFSDFELEDLNNRDLIIYSPFPKNFLYYLNNLDYSKMRLFFKKNNVKIHTKTKKKIKTILLNKKMKWKLSKPSRVFLEKLLELEEIR